jgi:hypothetical protein
MSTETKFVDGMRVFAPRDGAPDFIIANVVVNVEELQAWLAQRSGEVRIDIKESRGGKYYASENDYRPSGRQEGGQERAPKPQRQPAPEQTGGGFEDDDVPF